jgi:single-stranded-DNA-specific exonuclease
MSEFHSKIAGVTAKNPNGSNRQDHIKQHVKSGSPLILLREPNNEYDANAIAAYIKFRTFLFFTSTVQIGYLNKEVAEELTKFIAKGGTVTGKVKEVTGGKGKESFGVNILLTKQST